MLKNSKQRRIFFFSGLLIIVILVLGLINISKLWGPIVMPDETGFWAAGAFFSGKDWSGTIKLAPYYGLGYGFLQAPLMLIFDDPVIIFRAAIVLNVLFMVGDYFIAVIVAKNLFPHVNIYIRCLASFVITVYSSFLYNSQTTYVESVVVFIFWLIILLMIRLIQNPKIWYSIFMAIAVAYLFALHQRTLGILIAVIMTYIILLCQKKINWKNILAFIVGVAVIVGCILIIKSNLVTEMYQNGSSVATNDFSGQAGKILYIFTPKGFISLCINVIGRIMYLGTATFGMIYVGIFFICKTIFRQIYNWKKKISDSGKDDLVVLKFFMILCLLAAIGISAIFMISGSRNDHIIYGRYSEYVIAPILLIALLSLDKLKKIGLFQTIIVILQIGLCAIIFLVFQHTDLTQAGAYAIAGIYGIPVVHGISEEVRLTFWTGGIAMVVFCIIFMLYYLNKKRKFTYSMIFLAAMWVLVAWNMSNMKAYNESEYEEKLYSYALDVRDMVGDNPIYYVIEDKEYYTNNYWQMYRLQFFLPDTKLIAVTQSELEELDGYDFIMVFNTSQHLDKFMNEKVLLNQKGPFYLFTNNDNTKIINNIPDNWKGNDVINSSPEIVDGNKASQFIINEEVAEGTYEMYINISLGKLADKEKIEFSINNEKEGMLYEREMIIDDFKDNQLDFSVPLTIDSGFEKLELKWNVPKESSITVNQINFYRVSAEIREGEVYQEEIDKIIKDIKKIGKNSRVIFVSEKDLTEYSGEYLRDEIPGIQSMTYAKFLEKNMEEELILLKRTQDIFNYTILLDKYIILDATEHYLLLSNQSNKKAISSIGKNECLSKENTFSYLCIGKQEDIDSGILNFPRSGGYSIDIPVSKNESKDVSVVLYSGNTNLESQGIDPIIQHDKEEIHVQVIIPEENSAMTIKVKGVDLSDSKCWVSKDIKGDYIIFLYEEALGRTPSVQEANDWYNGWLSDEYTMEDIIAAFLLSDEAQGKIIEDNEFIKILYKVCWQQNPDESMDKWPQLLEEGNTREDILKYFLNDSKFSELKTKYVE